MKLALITDAWLPQVNGVVTTLQRTRGVLEALGHSVTVISPEQFRTLPCPTYPEIRLALLPGRRIARALEAWQPDAIHIATEGPLGLAAARYCTRRGLAFTTSYHTQFPQYLRKRAPIPESWSYAFLRRHHSRARRTLVATEHQRRDLVAHGFHNVVIWSRGVDADLFKPGDRSHLALPRPIFAYAGRVAVEKNLDAFLALDLPGTKVVIGDGPDRAMLERRYPDARFLGYRFGTDLSGCLASADAFVFPSRTDTFGLVMLEAMACGTPVAAFPVTGPIDVVTHGYDGVLDENLRTAALRALSLDRADCRRTALAHSWERAAAQFLSHLVGTRGGGELGLDGLAEPSAAGP
ncbi:MAG TPA: glycosyltransferase family 1 protein [Gammaproteobacteria bacterium]|nr:glycosyltransferase family 1 protein [Gammaproteobacteria bacterium]